MTENIEFTRNYSDQSSDQGFQFEFYCDRCGSGHRTPFKPFVLGSVSGAMSAASSLLGGIFNQAADLTERARSATWEKAHDAAFEDAMTILRPDFVQCPHCNSWVCRSKCWNQRRGLCKNCAPDENVEMAAAQAQKTREKIWENAASSEEDAKTTAAGNFKQTIKAGCPHCGAPLPKPVKFCPECGQKLETIAHCTECGAKLQPGAKFCAECGAKATTS